MSIIPNFLHKRSSGGPLGIGTGPEADWKLIFLSSLVLAVLVIGLSAYIFVQIDKGDIFVIERIEETGGRRLNAAALREAVSYYQGKAVEFERLKGESAPVVDPSL